MSKGGEVWGDCLKQALSSAREEVVLVAPFITLEAFRRLFEVVPEAVFVRCITRWLPHDIAFGVTDIDIWPVIKARELSELLLLNRLHAKYFRIDKECFVGSANITQPALGWSSNPNVELLVRVSAEELRGFEDELIRSSFPATDDLYQSLIQHVKHIREGTEPESSSTFSDTLTSQSKVDDTYWLPSLRDPSLLFDAYIGSAENLTTAAKLAASADLAYLSLPKGLSKTQFKSYVAVILLQTGVVRRIDSYVSMPRRFGEVRRYLKTLECANAPQFDATRDWQTLMRWLLYFLPDRYTSKVFRYSEVFQRRDIEII